VSISKILSTRHARIDRLCTYAARLLDRVEEVVKIAAMIRTPPRWRCGPFRTSPATDDQISNSR